MAKKGPGQARKDDVEMADVPGAEAPTSEEIMTPLPSGSTGPVKHSSAIMASSLSAETVLETDDVDREDIPSHTGDTSELEEKRSDIENTRINLSATVDAIQEKLSPSHLAQQATDAVREATVGRVHDAASSVADSAKGLVTRPASTASHAGSTVAESIKRNPGPVALIGIGLGWLVIRARQATSTHNDHPDQEGTRTYAGQAQQAISDTVGQVQSAVGDTVGQVQDTATQSAGQIQTAAGQVTGQAQDQMSQLSNQAQYGAQQAARRFQTTLQQNPLGVGAVAVALGLAAGLAIPSTAKEDQLMGDARDSAVEKAQKGVQETMEKAQTVAQEVLDVAKGGAEREGLAG